MDSLLGKAVQFLNPSEEKQDRSPAGGAGPLWTRGEGSELEGRAKPRKGFSSDSGAVVVERCLLEAWLRRSESRWGAWLVPRITHFVRLCPCSEPLPDRKQIFEFQELSRAAEHFVDSSHFLCCSSKPRRALSKALSTRTFFPRVVCPRSW